MTSWNSSISKIRDSAELFRGLDRREVDLILAGATARCFSSQSAMTHQADDAQQILLLLKGRGRYFFQTPDGKKLILMWITPGQILGAAALASPPSTYIVSTEAVRESVALAWDGSTIRTLARQFPRLQDNLFVIAMDYISWYVAAHAALISQTAQERLAHLVLGYAPSIGHAVPGGIELTVTNEELADAANITPYTASRLISRWSRNGAIRKLRGKILLRSPKKLFL
jgi:CRP-like cAMP-binding protein